MCLMVLKLESENELTSTQIQQLVREGRKSRALLLIRLRNLKTKELEKIDEQLLSVLKMIEDIEWETINVQALQALEKGTEALKDIHSYISPERLQVLLEENEDAMQMEDEISAILSKAGADLSDGDLEEEYAALLNERTVPLDLPVAPSTPLPIQSREETIPALVAS